jgi:tetratricopeptide (TPR) repeat protein
MSTSIPLNEPVSFFHEKQIADFAESLTDSFKKLTRFYVLFHLFFALLVFFEVVLFAVFFSFWIQSATISFLLASFLLTGFSYFVLLSYFQTKKPQQLYELGQSFIANCKSSLSHEDLLALPHAIYRVILYFDRIEAAYYNFPLLGETLNLLLKKFSIYCHWRDALKMKEFLLLAAIGEHIALIKKEPTDLEAHAALAEAYLKLARLYKEPQKEEGGPSLPWIPPDYASESMQTKFRRVCERAIEEYKIIEAYVPEDPWVHAQLAGVYHEIGQIEKEIAEYEKMLQISPNDKAVLFHLGSLYFQQGKTARGLQTYEFLKKLRDENADALLAFYDAFRDSL